MNLPRVTGWLHLGHVAPPRAFAGVLVTFAIERGASHRHRPHVHARDDDAWRSPPTHRELARRSADAGAHQRGRRAGGAARADDSGARRTRRRHERRRALQVRRRVALGHRRRLGDARQRGAVATPSLDRARGAFSPRRRANITPRHAPRTTADPPPPARAPSAHRSRRSFRSRSSRSRAAARSRPRSGPRTRASRR